MPLFEAGIRPGEGAHVPACALRPGPGLSKETFTFMPRVHAGDFSRKGESSGVKTVAAPFRPQAARGLVNRGMTRGCARECARECECEAEENTAIVLHRTGGFNRKGRRKPQGKT